LWRVALGTDGMSQNRLSSMSLALWGLLAGSLGLLLLQLVRLDTVQKIGTALAVGDVLNTDGDPLSDNATLDPLVDNDTNGLLGHVENTTSLAMIRLVGHTLLESAITLKEIIIIIIIIISKYYQFY
jgi:hypothetical protein